MKRLLKIILRPMKSALLSSRWGDVSNYRKRFQTAQKNGMSKHLASRFIFHRKDRVKQFLSMFEKIKISLREGSRFQHWIDDDLYFVNHGQLMDALSPDFSVILEKSIDDLVNEYNCVANKISANNCQILLGVKKYIERIVRELNGSQFDKSRKYFARMVSSKAESLEEALQRILFWSSLFWQSGHSHIGLGRFDKLVEPYLNEMSDDELIKIFIDFYEELHRYYAYKSCGLLGDTGQILILGGLAVDGSYYSNRATYCCIKALTQMKLPDPKILLRVSRSMPKDLLMLAAECNATGIGCPLLSNDDVVIPALQKFGYEENDAFDYITSACWEPFCYGKALGRGNLGQINFAKAFEKTYLDPGFERFPSFDALLSSYKQKLIAEVRDQIRKIDSIRWERNPLMTIFTKGCMEKNKDVGDGGAVYNDYGILSVGLANVIDSLFNIKRMCYDQPVLTLEKVKQILLDNYENNEEMRVRLNQNSYYGHSEPAIVKLINELVEAISSECADYRNYLGGKLKFGLSSFAYMDEGKKTMATFDGRKSGMALSTHMSSKLGEPYTELVNFAGNLDYSGIRCNGNVVDFFVAPAFIQNNIEKFTLFLYSGTKVGFFQMQMNVVSSETLIAAKKNPDLYPNIVVRVWGFSAYFNDLPEEYKDLLIRRALDSEMVA